MFERSRGEGDKMKAFCVLIILACAGFILHTCHGTGLGLAFGMFYCLAAGAIIERALNERG
jgi:hypothetical protein